MHTAYWKMTVIGLVAGIALSVGVTPAMAHPYLGGPPDESASSDLLWDYLGRLSHSDAISQVLDISLLHLGEYYQLHQFDLAFNTGSVTENLENEIIPIDDGWLVTVVFEGEAVDVLEVHGGEGNWYGQTVHPASVAQGLSEFLPGDRVVMDPSLDALWVSRDNEIKPLNDVAFDVSASPISLGDYQQLRLSQTAEISSAIQGGQLAIGGGIGPLTQTGSDTPPAGVPLVLWFLGLAIVVCVVILSVVSRRGSRSTPNDPRQ